MSNSTNGYVVGILDKASKKSKHREHAEAETYLRRFRAMEDEFFANVHPLVDVGLAMHEVEVALGSVPHIFTIHGCRHIVDLIRSLDKIGEAIRDDSKSPLTVLEAYILLCAAHVHDVANISKRANHPERCNEIITRYKTLFASTFVMQQVYQVASVHGESHPIYGKDTFRSLDADNSQTPRLPMLAAMLRLGDELSENPERVPGLVAATHNHSDESKLAFAYARAFQRFRLVKGHLYLSFGIYPDDASLTARVNGEDVSFYEFLEGKLDVIDREARYCSQYGRPAFHIEGVHVTIMIHHTKAPSSRSTPHAFTWPLLHGYPGSAEKICSRSPELKAMGVMTLAESLA